MSPSERIRLDKWLWHARLYRTRALAQAACATGKIRVNSARTQKAHQLVGPGDVLTLALGGRVRVLKVRALAERRGAVAAAALLYHEVPSDTPEARSGETTTGR